LFKQYKHCVTYISSGLPGPEPEPIYCFSFLPASYASPPVVLGLDLGLHQPKKPYKRALFQQPF